MLLTPQADARRQFCHAACCSRVCLWLAGGWKVLLKHALAGIWTWQPRMVAFFCLFILLLGGAFLALLLAFTSFVQITFPASTLRFSSVITCRVRLTFVRFWSHFSRLLSLRRVNRLYKIGFFWWTIFLASSVLVARSFAPVSIPETRFRFLIFPTIFGSSFITNLRPLILETGFVSGRPTFTFVDDDGA